jgi:hypothetical protein
MAKSEKGRILLNRIVSFLAGGLLVFAVLSFTVIGSAKKQITDLTSALDASQYEAGRLLAEAKNYLAEDNFAAAMSALNVLFEKQPGSAETVEGRKLALTIETAEKAANAKWEAAMPGIRKQWASDLASQLRAKMEATRVQLEKDMNDTINQEWENSIASIRKAWELR